MIAGRTPGVPALKDIAKKIASERNLAPKLDRDAAYCAAEAEALASLGFAADAVARAQDFAVKEALVETERSTFQAMEALIHNLNTMHSRAGAQTPFSSINYGTDTSSEGRMVVRNVLKATESGLGLGETPIFPIQISG